LLGTARKPVDLAAYNLSDHALIDALCSLVQAAVRGRMYLDAGQLKETLLPALPSHQLYRLAQTSNVEVRVKQAAGLAHLKSYLVDSQVLRTGSANFSASGLKRQDNDMVVIRDARSIAQFAETFERLWARPDNKVWRPER
jgi:phosphatidylserine/phosphatidylglycerophosphate/cardiolipin synthase-like enzyme